MQDNSLRQKALRQLKVGAFVRLLGQALLWFTTLFTVRLLSPEDYGLLSMSFILVTYSGFLTELGLGASIVQAKDLTTDAVRAVFGWITSANLLLCLLFFTCAPAISRFFGEPEIVLPIRILSLTLVFSSLSVLPAAFLVRALRIKELEVVRMTAAVVSGLLTLTLASMGFGFWALVIGQVCLPALRMIGLWTVSPVKHLPSLRIGAALENLRFGGWKAAAAASWEFIDRIDFFLIAKMMSKYDVGVYTVAVRFASLPLDKVGSLIQSVGLTSYSKIQEDAPKVAATVLSTTQAASLVSFPVFVGLCFVTPELIQIIFGDKWNAAIVPMQIICLVQPIRLLHNVTVPAIDGTGKPRLNALAGLSAALCFLIAYLIAARFTVETMALAMLLAIIPWFIAAQAYRLRSVAISYRAYARAAMPGLFGSVVMALVLGGVQATMIEQGALLLMLVKVLAGAAVYASVVGLFFRRQLMASLTWAT